MNTKYVVGIIVVVIILIAGYLLLAKPAPATGVTDTQQAADVTGANTAGTNATAAPDTNGSTGVTAGVSATVAAPVTVTYTDAGFSPSSVTIKKGQSVTFVNKSSGAMWVASASHPDHTDYDGTSRTTHCAAGYAGPAPFDECGTGTSYTFTFTQVGSWGYHNHASTESTGVVVVTE